MGSQNSNSNSILPKISRKLATRTLALVIVVGSMAYGLEWFLKVRTDLKGLQTSNTVGWISAIQYLPDGQQIVLISPDGKIHKDTGYKAHTTDKDAAWSPHGNFLYFVSDRNEHNFNLFRWSPSTDEPAEQRTTGTRARSNPKFPAESLEEKDSVAKALITCGGLIQQFDPTNQSTEQVLPPTSKEIAQSQATGDENPGGIESQFTGVYGNLGTSFREAQWCGGKTFIAGIMRRDNGEILVLQGMEPVNGKIPQPRAVAAGDRIEMCVNPKDGNLIFTVQNFRWPEATPMDANGKPIRKPFVNGIVNYDLKTGKGDLIMGDSKLAFTSPQVRPDGTCVLAVVGDLDSGSFTPRGMLTAPTVRDPNFKGIRVPGEIHEPSWSPDGTHIVFAVRNGGKRTLFDYRIDDPAPRNISGDEGDFGFPRFSPQTKSDN